MSNLLEFNDMCPCGNGLSYEPLFKNTILIEDGQELRCGDEECKYKSFAVADDECCYAESFLDGEQA